MLDLVLQGPNENVLAATESVQGGSGELLVGFHAGSWGVSGCGGKLAVGIGKLGGGDSRWDYFGKRDFHRYWE